MNLFKIIAYILGIGAIVFIFFDWRIAVGLFLLASALHVIPLGPNSLLNVIAGYLVLGGIICLFLDWRIGIALMLSGFLVTKFRIWSNKQG